MARLADRMLEGCAPCRPSLLVSREELDASVRDFIARKRNVPSNDPEVEKLIQMERSRILLEEPSGIERFDPSIFNNAPIFAVDDVATYLESLPLGTSIHDVVGSMAPPFDKFFAEYQGVPNRIHNVHACGALVQAHEGHGFTEAFSSRFPDVLSIPRWMLELTIFLERVKGKPYGPVATTFIALTEDGTWCRQSNGKPIWITSLVEFDGPKPTFFDNREAIISNFGQVILPILASISFMHCKNVDVRDCTPPEKLSLSHEKKYGQRLVRYHVLDIQPLRQLLDRYRTGSQNDLRHALHICRGHFKTFTEDAPHLGRHTGTFWWAPSVRGKKEVGVVIKDYRVKAPAEFGTAYREANDALTVHQKQAGDTDDPDQIGLGLAAHNRTQNAIAETVQTIGWNARSPASNEPEYDLAWKTESGLFVCEVKSISPANEERQMRMAIGQVIRYRQKLTASGYEPVTTVIAIEKQPKDLSWEDLCRDEDIVLIWPETAEKVLRAECNKRREEVAPL